MTTFDLWETTGVMMQGFYGEPDYMLEGCLQCGLQSLDTKIKRGRKIQMKDINFLRYILECRSKGEYAGIDQMFFDKLVFRIKDFEEMIRAKEAGEDA